MQAFSAGNLHTNLLKKKKLKETVFQTNPSII